MKKTTCKCPVAEKIKYPRVLLEWVGVFAKYRIVQQVETNTYTALESAYRDAMGTWSWGPIKDGPATLGALQALAGLIAQGTLVISSPDVIDKFFTEDTPKLRKRTY